MLKTICDTWSSNTTSNGLDFSITFLYASSWPSITSTSLRRFFFISTRLWWVAKSLSTKHAKALVSGWALIDSSWFGNLICIKRVKQGEGFEGKNRSFFIIEV